VVEGHHLTLREPACTDWVAPSIPRAVRVALDEIDVVLVGPVRSTGTLVVGLKTIEGFRRGQAQLQVVPALSRDARWEATEGDVVGVAGSGSGYGGTAPVEAIPPDSPL